MAQAKKAVKIARGSSLGSAFLNCSACLAALAVALPARALTFNWEFSFNSGSPTQTGVVKGTISGLQDNTSNQLSGLTVTVTEATNTPPGGWNNNWIPKYYAPNDNPPAGFNVANGQVTSYQAVFVNNVVGQELYLANDARWIPELYSASPYFDNYPSSNTPITFTQPSQPVPGPLPILGAASAFAWSRRVRSRLRSAKKSCIS